MMKKYKGKPGWFKESQRHSLASKGIKTGRKSRNTSSLFLNADYAKLMSSKEFRIDDNTTIIARAEDTRSGFRHVVDIYKDGNLVDSAKVTYQNRTWESFEFETAINKLLDKTGMSDEEKKKIMDRLSGKSHEETEQQFKTIGAIASMGEIFGKGKKEKNDWKLRMLKAGLENKGLQVPEDWDTLSEDEKEKRLNKIIEMTRQK